VNDDELKRLLDSHAAETRRHFDIAQEHDGKRFDAVNEAITSLAEQTQRWVQRLEERITRESSVGNLQQWLGRIEETIH
jgi:hypothetical protein